MRDAIGGARKGAYGGDGAATPSAGRGPGAGGRGAEVLACVAGARRARGGGVAAEEEEAERERGSGARHRGGSEKNHRPPLLEARFAAETEKAAT